MRNLIVIVLIGSALYLGDMVAPYATPKMNEYRIGPEDILEISVWHEEGLQKEVLVQPDGVLTFPLIGQLRASGKTVEQIRSAITSRLNKFIPDPTVTVSLKRIGGNKIYIIGKVNKPGEYLTGRYVDVMQALSMAGGLTPFAAQNKIRILRREKGQEMAIPFDYNSVEKGHDLEQNILLTNGDVVVVP